jgi:bifunctional non-homologous end joining protein LigD
MPAAQDRVLAGGAFVLTRGSIAASAHCGALARPSAPGSSTSLSMGNGAAFFRQACQLKAEGIVSKRVDSPYRPGDRSGAWLKAKCLNREEFIIVGWTDPEGSRAHLGALLLAYYAPDGRLVYAGRAGTGMPVRELARVAARLKPLATDRMPIDVPPPRGSRFGSPLVLSRVHWVRPELVAEVTYLEWTDDGLLRQVVYQGLREDKPASDVRRRPAARAVNKAVIPKNS